MNDRVVGATLARPDGHRGHLYHLAVTEPWQCMGIGRAPVDAALEDLATVGIARGHAIVLADNADATIFWGRRGWHESRDPAIHIRGEQR